MIRRAKRKAKKCKKKLCMKYCETKSMQDALLWNFFMDFFYFASLEISMSIALNFSIITVNDNVNDMAGIILCYFYLAIYLVFLVFYCIVSGKINTVEKKRINRYVLRLFATGSIPSSWRRTTRRLWNSKAKEFRPIGICLC